MLKKAIFREYFSADRLNHGHEKFSEDFQCPIWIENMFSSIRSINRTNSQPIWTRICGDIPIMKKVPQTPPLKKEIPM